MAALASTLESHRAAQTLPLAGASLAWAVKVAETARQLRQAALSEGMPADEFRVEAWAARVVAKATNT